MDGSTAIDPALVARFKAALDRLNPDGGKIGLAVSGGPDSMAMLLLACEAIPGGFEVATVDHGLRPEAKDEGALVVAACEERGVPCEVLSVEVGEGNVQAKAREARYRALHAWSGRRDIRTIATAHHANDQMETMLMRLNRGSGVAGLSGILERTSISVDFTALGRTMGIIRPLLQFSRDELLSIVEASGVGVADDPSNADTAYERVRIRNALKDCDWLDPKGFAASARHLEDAELAVDLAVNWYLGENSTPIEGGLRCRIPFHPSLRFPLLQSQFRLMAADARGSDLARLLERLERGESGNVAGVLVTIEGEDWVFRPEPPRRTG